MATVYFVTTDDVSKYTPVNLNCEVSIIKKAILDAQQLKIQDVLGSKLYKKIEALIISGIEESGNAVYKTLLDDYIFNCTLHWVLVEILPYSRFKIMNVGVNTQSSDNSQPAAFDEFKYLQTMLTNKAEFYTTRMKDFLVANYTDYPEYSDLSCECDGELSPNKTTYFSGIEFY